MAEGGARCEQATEREGEGKGVSKIRVLTMVLKDVMRRRGEVLNDVNGDGSRRR